MDFNYVTENTNENDIPDETSFENITIMIDGKLTQEQQMLIKKLDKEASTRTLYNPIISQLFYWNCAAVSLYHFVTSYFGTPVVKVPFAARRHDVCNRVRNVPILQKEQTLPI